MPNDDDTTTNGGEAHRPNGRPPLLTPALLKRAVLLARQGHFRSTLARRLGVHPKTFERWMRLGKRSSEGLYAELCARVPQAEARFECDAVRLINEAAKTDAKYACWLLERRFPKRWGRHHGEFGEMKRRLRDLERQMDAIDAGSDRAGD